MKKILNARLEHLLATKKFGELTAEERYFVTETVSEVEYEHMHFILKNAPASLKNTPDPSPAIRQNLLAAMQQMKTDAAPQQPHRNTTGAAIVRLLRTRIPAWQAAAAVALLLGLHFFMPEKINTETITETEYVHHIDTIYKEIERPPLPSPAPAIASKKGHVKAPIRVNVRPHQSTQTPLRHTEDLALIKGNRQENFDTERPDTFALMVSHPRGQSAKQTKDLWQFFGQVH